MNNTFFNFKMLIFALLFGAMSCITVLLFFEYHYFKQECNKMIALRNDYQWYKQTYQKLLLEYMQLKQSIARLGSTELLDKESLETITPENSCFWVNREPDYLRSAALEFGKAQNLPRLFDQLYAEDEWLIGQGELWQEVQQKKQQHKPKQRLKKSSPVYVPQPLAKGHHHRDLHLHWPIDRTLFWISSIFGPRKKANSTWDFHYGIDLAALKGIPVKAATTGTVMQACVAPGYGKMVVIKHTQKYYTRYAHLDTMAVAVGQTVKAGTVLGTVGNTGLVRGKNGAENAHHLHFEVLVHGKQINPLYLLS